MKYQIKDKVFNIEIVRKKNKNTYMKIKDATTLLVTTSRFITDKQILKIVEENENFVYNNLKKCDEKKDKEENFYLFGKKYDIIITSSFELEIIEDKIYVKSYEYLDKWLKNEIKKTFKEHLDNYYNLFEENIPYPLLKIRKMKTRWGVCNRKNNSVTLNYDLYKYEIEALDYVIIHELSHFVHFNHSKSFWTQVSKYCENYKEIRKYLKE